MTAFFMQIFINSLRLNANLPSPLWEFGHRGNEKGVREWYTNKNPNAGNNKQAKRKNGGYIENRYF